MHTMSITCLCMSICSTESMDMKLHRTRHQYYPMLPWKESVKVSTSAVAWNTWRWFLSTEGGPQMLRVILKWNPSVKEILWWDWLQLHNSYVAAAATTAAAAANSAATAVDVVILQLLPLLIGCNLKIIDTLWISCAALSRIRNMFSLYICPLHSW